VSVLAHTPLARGALTGKYTVRRRPEGMRRDQPLFRPRSMRRVQRLVSLLREIGRAHDATPAQVSLRWLIQRGVVPIPGAKTRDQAIENSGALRFELESSEMDELDRASSPVPRR
jgi:aryl-alcohol dehydrogenase-like predicted oxidoreductase